MKKLLRLWVMTTIKHSEEYYQKGMESAGIAYKEMTHNEIAIWKASAKAIEADLLIELAYNQPVTKSSEIDTSKIIK